MSILSAEQLTGRVRSHVLELPESDCVLHPDAAAAFLDLRAAASQSDIDLVAVSSFRSFERQLLIWNDKFHGRRALLGRDGSVLDRGVMTEEQLVGAILLGGVFAKVISTANNYLFSPASNLIHDVYKRFIDPRASERRTLIVSRGLVIALGLFALLQAAYFESVLKAALYAYTVYGAAVTPSVMAVFFWKRANKAGAISSIVLGTVITMAWQILDIQWLDAVYPALGVSVLALIVVSLATAPPTRANLEPFEK